MKKSIVLLVAVVALIVLATGCGKKETLVCTQSIRGGILTFNVDFDGSVITAMDFDYEMDLSSYSDNKIVIENYLIKPNYNIQNYKYKNKDYK